MEKKMENFNNKNLINIEKEYNEIWDAIVNNGIATENELEQISYNNGRRIYNELWDLIIDNKIANELELISYINKRQIETLKDVLYVRTGYRDAQQYKARRLD